MIDLARLLVRLPSFGLLVPFTQAVALSKGERLRNQGAARHEQQAQYNALKDLRRIPT
jgi:hypothetical protein